jgi:hypothetical protein
VDLPADVTIAERQVEVSYQRRSHLPIVLASGLLGQAIPITWWNGRSLSLITCQRPWGPPKSLANSSPWKSTQAPIRTCEGSNFRFIRQSVEEKEGDQWLNVRSV